MLRALFCAALLAGPAQAQDAGGLRARHSALQDKLANNPFGRALHVESAVAGNAQKGEIYAAIDKPFAVVSRALARPAHWCDILTLQVNIKGCEASGDDMLSALITRKPRDPVDSAHRLDLRFQLAAARADYLHVAMNSATGPMGTRDYEIRLEAAPIDAQRTFIHLSYAYTWGRWRGSQWMPTCRVPAGPLRLHRRRAPRRRLPGVHRRRARRGRARGDALLPRRRSVCRFAQPSSRAAAAPLVHGHHALPATARNGRA